MKISKRSFPIHVHIVTIIIFVVAIASGTQMALSNKAMSEVIFKANSKIFERIAEQTKYQLNSHYGTAFSALGSFSNSHSLNASVGFERLRVVPEVIHLLSRFDHVQTYTFSFKDGDSVIVKRVSEDLTPDIVINNQQSRYIVAHEIGGVVEVYTYDSSLNFVERLEVNEEEFHLAYQDNSSVIPGRNTISKPTKLANSTAMGVVISQVNQQGLRVSVHVMLKDLHQSLQDTLTNESSIRVLYNDDGAVYAFSSGLSSENNGDILQIADINRDIVPHAIDRKKGGVELGRFEFQKENWFGRIVTIKPMNSEHIHLLMATKASSIFDEGLLIKQQTLYASLIVLLLMLPCIYLVSRLISKPIVKATEKAKAIENFSFDTSPLPHSYIKEIQELNHAQMSTQATISRFITLTDGIARQQDLDSMLELVCGNTAASVSADGVLLYLLDVKSDELVPHVVQFNRAQNVHAKSISTQDAARFIEHVFVNKQGQVFPLHELNHLQFEASLPEKSEVIYIPLKNREEVVIGALGLMFEKGGAESIYREYSDYLQTLLGYVSIAIETQQMLESQRALLDSFIQVFAGSLDKKSPYTGNHCQRVPVLTEWLTQAAHESTLEPFNDFHLNEKEWQELKMAAWLHDCGKITTPEHVVDKSTKLETIYDRIHEIRTRFEVIKRDKEIMLLKESFGELSQEAKRVLEELHTQIDDDFDFIASLNIGGEFVSDEDLKRLERIAKTRWIRTLSKRKGISWVERQRHQTEEQLPQQETLLANMPEHLISWDTPHQSDPRFTMKPTQYKANQGEVYNLSTRRGTLTEEERFIINDHIIQTIQILESLPFPAHMQNVASIAGGHHEKMDGTGYPMGLKGEEMPLAARVMAIADVFEALTSADRPYKKAKTLSESLKIMSYMVKDNHLDESLFRLFLTSGVYLRFAREYMLEEQIDEVNIAAFL
ncbi:HD domain-containing phosphohydrolase [Vibrio maritimus]|uniref:HD domain-containing phosphohydrolase n=1 Tax=Vibrio maritimus TaxID=990268 RepID=UPI001F445FB3|nr:HD domain-containing phosphohydrolase [Vibrio maritimus]